MTLEDVGIFETERVARKEGKRERKLLNYRDMNMKARNGKNEA